MAENYAEGFRNCLVAASGCVLGEVDYSGVEAVLAGYFMHDPNFVRIAKLGMHANLASHILGRPADITLPDLQLYKIFQEIKATEEYVYNQAKRCTHGIDFGLTPFGAHKQFPKEFPTIADADKVFKLFHSIAPNLKSWHANLREHAHRFHYLGGREGQFAHPFGFRHWFWNVFQFQKISESKYKELHDRGEQVSKWKHNFYRICLGSDAKAVIAFFPQSTAAGIVFASALRLMDKNNPNYIGDLYFGKTPLRAVIHDSLLLECPEPILDVMMQRVVNEMLAPIKELPMPDSWGLGPYLTIGAEAKVGPSWGQMEKYPLPTIQTTDEAEFEEEEDEEEVGWQEWMKQEFKG